MNGSYGRSADAQICEEIRVLSKHELFFGGLYSKPLNLAVMGSG